MTRNHRAPTACTGGPSTSSLAEDILQTLPSSHSYLGGYVSKFGVPSSHYYLGGCGSKTGEPSSHRVQSSSAVSEWHEVPVGKSDRSIIDSECEEATPWAAVENAVGNASLERCIASSLTSGLSLLSRDAEVYLTLAVPLSDQVRGGGCRINSI